MPNRRGISLSFQKQGILGLFSHVASILFGDPRLNRSASTVDMRLAQLTFVQNVEGLIRQACHVGDDSLIRNYINEAEAALNENERNLNTPLVHPTNWDSGKSLQILMYVSIRILKPDIVIETGTANGRSAAAIASALSANKFGKLYSYDVLKTTAPYIQEKNRRHVSLVTLDGKPESLRKHIAALPRVSGVQIFLHDSDHSYPNQMSDYQTAKELGFDLLVSDDVDASLAFCDFSRKEGSVMLDGSKIIGLQMLQIS